MTLHFTRWMSPWFALALTACPAADGDSASDDGSEAGPGTSGDSTGPTTGQTADATAGTSGGSESTGTAADSSDSGGSSSADSTTGDVACGDPVPFGSFTPSDGGAAGFDVAGDTVYLAVEDGGLAIVDVSDPAAPTEVGIVDFGSGRLAHRVAIGPEGIVFVGLRAGGWAVVDVSDPAAPMELYGDDTIAGQDVAWADDVLYVTDVNGVQTYDVTDPAAPVPLSTDNVLPGSTQTVELAGGYAYAAGLGAGLSVVDISDPAAPTEIVTTDHDGRGELAIAGDRAYLLSNDGVHVIDIADPTQPTELGMYAGEQLEGVAADDRLWVLGRDTTNDMNPTVAVVDVGDPATPVLAGSYDAQANPLWIEVADGRVFYSEDDDEQLHILDGCP